MLGVAWILAALLAVPAYGVCPVSRPASSKIPGDGGYRILISGDYERYIPNAIYTISLRGTADFERNQQFSNFTLSVDSQNGLFTSTRRLGYFQIFPDSLAQFNEECVNTLSETSGYPKYEIQAMWRAPPSGSGCVKFTATIVEDAQRWYAEDGNLSKIFCEMSPQEIENLDESRCCACDEATYKMVFEGIWSNITHPNDFPTAVLHLTHFSDVIGASHQTNFSFWGRDQIATDGFRQLAEWGSTAGLESEFRQDNYKYFKSFFKAPGLWYPRVNSNTSHDFEVDKKHPMLSLSSKIGPSPDWVVGVSKLNLCQKDCSWIKSVTIDLYPWDAGTDNGITYMSPNSETNPREKMKPITTKYPEDPRSPFYDPSGRPMLPVARLYVSREKIRRQSCSEYVEKPDNHRNDEDPQDILTRLQTNRKECATTDFSGWSECSVTCGTGVRTRTRSYRTPVQAASSGCSEQLVSKEICLATIGECLVVQKKNKGPSAIENLGECLTSQWSSWSKCSKTCGIGYRTRTRRLLNQNSPRECLNMTFIEKEKCLLPPCRTSAEGQDSVCEVSDWSEWSPCSMSCGKGVKTRTRYLTAPKQLQKECTKKVELKQQRQCLEQADCTFDAAAAKAICSEKLDIGPCRGYLERWAYNTEKLICEKFGYGGCYGNKNNFETSEECLKFCSVGEGGLIKDTETTHSHYPRNLFTSAIGEFSPVDCRVSEWSPWSACSVTCGSGLIASYRTVTKEPRNGGKACPMRLQRRMRCHLKECTS